MAKLFNSSLVILLLLAAPASASDLNLLGDWGGMRTYLEERGISPDVVLTMDFARNTRGGIDQHGTMLGNLDIMFTIDTKQAGLWENGTFSIYFLGNSVTNRPLTEIVGDLQTTSNIEAEETFVLYEAWYEHQFSQEAISVLVGLHDYNSEFDVLEFTGLFPNSSPGVQPTISQVGPSIFPQTTAMAGRLRLSPSENTYIMTALYDGISGDPNHTTRTAVRFDDGDRIFAGLEAGQINGSAGAKDYYKIALGTWLHTARVELFDGSTNSENKGVYFIAETALYAENDNGEGLGGFVEFGLADAKVNQIGSYWSTGINYVGLLPGRNGDILGLAIMTARNGSDYMDFIKAEGGEVDHSETAIELTYRAELLPWLVVQPDLQYIINPSMDPSLDNALVAMVRTEIHF